MSKYKLDWQHPKSLNHIALGILLLTAWLFLSFPVATTWWLSVFYFLLISAISIAFLKTWKLTSSPCVFIGNESGAFECSDSQGERRVFHYQPTLSVQTDYFCLLVLVKATSDNEQPVMTSLTKFTCLRLFLSDCCATTSPRLLADSNSTLSILLLPADSLSDTCYRRLNRVMKQASSAQ